MTVQKLVFNMKEDGWSDTAVMVGICQILTDRGYRVTDTTRLVIEKHLKNYAAFNEVA